jgi:hypothetical protein
MPGCGTPHTIPCRGCGKPATTIFCAECAPNARCPHGHPLGDCNACDVEGDLAFDSNREGQRP